MYRILRQLTVVTYLLLLITLFGSTLAFGPSDIAAAIALGVAKCVGLLFVCWGLMREEQRSYIWLCFIQLMYFIAIVQALFIPSEGYRLLLEWIVLVLIIVNFTASMLCARFFPR